MRKYFTVIFIFFCALAQAAEKSHWYSKENGEVQLKLELFTTSTCPVCKKAKAFAREQLKDKDWIELKIYTINQSTQDLIDFHQRMKSTGTGEMDYMVPSFFFCGVRYVGFKSADTTGRDLLKSLTYCRQQIENQHKLSSATKKILTRWASGPFQQSQSSEPFSWKNTLFMAFLDALDPCSFFAFVLFLSFIVIHASTQLRLKLALILFVLMGVGHYLQQVEAVLYYHSLLWLRGVTVIVGAALLIWLRAFYTKERSSMALTSILAGLAFFLTYLYQQSCSQTNVALNFQNWLMNLRLPLWQTIIAQVIYQLCYLLPAILIFFVVIYCYSDKTPLRRQYYAKYTGTSFIILTAMILIIHPIWLSILQVSVLMGLLSLFFGWLGLRWRLRYYG